METIFHEKQEGSLCAQHCLNALLQGPYFNPVDLGTLAQKMDDEERLRMAECGEESEEYRRFLEQPSGNMDDSGYFSVQVIASALEVWGLELVPYTSTEQRAREAHTTPYKMNAFICNYKDHWFTVRRLGVHWFNLNSLLSRPELVSDTYLALFLAQLQQEGYSIFLVCGNLPECEADQLPEIRRPSVPEVTASQEEQELEEALQLSLTEPTEVVSDDEKELEKAVRLSLQGFSQDGSPSDDEDTELRKALELSLECKSNNPSAPSTPVADREQIRLKRLAFLERTNTNNNACSSKTQL